MRVNLKGRRNDGLPKRDHDRPRPSGNQPRKLDQRGVLSGELRILSYKEHTVGVRNQGKGGFGYKLGSM